MAGARREWATGATEVEKRSGATEKTAAARAAVLTGALVVVICAGTLVNAAARTHWEWSDEHERYVRAYPFYPAIVVLAAEAGKLCLSVAALHSQRRWPDLWAVSRDKVAVSLAVATALTYAAQNNLAYFAVRATAAPALYHSLVSLRVPFSAFLAQWVFGKDLTSVHWGGLGAMCLGAAALGYAHAHHHAHGNPSLHADSSAPTSPSSSEPDSLWASMARTLFGMDDSVAFGVFFSDALVGLVATLAVASLSSLGGILTQLSLQLSPLRDRTHATNILLYSFGLLINAVTAGHALLTRLSSQIQPQPTTDRPPAPSPLVVHASNPIIDPPPGMGPWELLLHYPAPTIKWLFAESVTGLSSPWPWISWACLTAGGLIVAAVVHATDAQTKQNAGIAAMALVAVFSVLFFGEEMGIVKFLGVCFVTGGLVAYTRAETSSRRNTAWRASSTTLSSSPSKRRRPTPAPLPPV